ncbi:MAG: AmmeMemoRadiSam system protein B [Sulfurifustis sp.]
MSTVRKPAVAGLFYTDDPRTLQAEIQRLLAAVPPTQVAPPKAIIAPHAGYIYSGPIAASVYARLHAVRTQVKRVILLGPAHRVSFHGIAAPSATYFETPLGRVRVDTAALAALRDLPQVVTLDIAHEREHSLEVHVPFLQMLFADFTLVPLVVGEAGPEEVAEVIERLWGGPETLIVVSSDLSHYHDYARAKQLDQATSQAIEHLRYEDIDYDDACGCRPVSGLLCVARRRGLRAETIDLRNSGDTAGPRDQVVGYGAYVFH